MTIKVSIIVPVYNVAEFIKECLDSLLCQSYRNIEIILVNDGSQDESGDICEKYKSIDGRIIVIHQENAGVSEAKNRGLETASGQYVLFVDPDDWVSDDIVEVLLEQLKTSGAESSLGSFERIWYSQTSIRNRVPSLFSAAIKSTKHYAFLPCWWADELTTRNVDELLVCTGRLFNLDILRRYDIRFVRGLHLLEDTLFGLTYFSKTDSVATTDRILYFYRQRYESSTGLSAANRDWVGNTEKSFTLIGRILEQWPGLSSEERKFSEKLVHSFYADLVIHSFFRYHKACSLSKTLKDIRRVSEQDLFLNALPDYVPKYDASVWFPRLIKNKKPFLAYCALRFHLVKNNLARFLKKNFSAFH